MKRCNFRKGLNTKQGSSIFKAIVFALLHLFLATAPSVLAIDRSQVPVINIAHRNGHLSVEARNANLKSLLHEIGSTLGVQTRYFGNSGAAVDVSFSDRPILWALRQIIEPRAMAIVYQGDRLSIEAKASTAQQMTAIWVFDTEYATPLPAQDPASLVQKVEGPLDGNDKSQTDAPAHHALIPNDRYRMLLLKENTEVLYWAEVLVQNAPLAAHRQAVEALSRIESKDAVEALSLFLGHSDARVRRCIVENLPHVDDSAAVRLIAQALWGDPDLDTQLAAVESLGRLNNDVARTFLEATSKGDDAAIVKKAALKALGW